MGNKLIALRNFSGPKDMILKGDIIEGVEPYVSDWTISGLCAFYTVRELPKPITMADGFKTMVKKGKK